MTNRSIFPESIDTFVELYDLPASLVTSATRYQELKKKAVLTSAEQNELNSLSIQLGDYIVTPETWNKFADAVVNVETFFKQEVDGYIDTKQLEWADYVKNFTYKGVYSGTTAYKFQNTVTYNGDLYLAIKDTIAGKAPTDTGYWQKISTKGDKGDTGLNAYYKGAYDNTKAYALGDAVDYNGLIYYCKLATTAGITPANGTYWFLWDRMIASSTAPATRQAGLLWIKLT